MGFKFAGTSPVNSAENYYAAVNDRDIDRPSYVSIVPGMFFCYFENTAHTTEQTMGRHICDGPSSETVTWLMRYTRPDPAGHFIKIRPFKLPNPSFHHHYFIISPITLSLSTSTTHSYINHRSLPPTIPQSPKSVNLLVGAAAVGVCLATEYLSICFSPFLRYVSQIFTHLSCIFLLVSISFVLCRMLFPLYDYV